MWIPEREHRVSALAILDAARALDDASQLVFTSGDSKPLDERCLRQLVSEAQDHDCTEGFGSSFGDWPPEETGRPR